MPSAFRLIALRGKYATGDHRFAIVDSDDYERLNRHKWKAKPNTNRSHMYAIRTTVRDGKSVDIRMHRDVMGVEPGEPVVVDHMNNRSLDNRKVNLRVGTQADNMRQAVIEPAIFACTVCGIEEVQVNRRATLSRWRNAGWTCEPCRKAARPTRQPKPKQENSCRWCGERFKAVKADQVYCSSACRYDAKNRERLGPYRRGPYDKPRQALRRAAVKLKPKVYK